MGKADNQGEEGSAKATELKSPPTCRWIRMLPQGRDGRAVVYPVERVAPMLDAMARY
jgi:hypothetical protein